MTLSKSCQFSVSSFDDQKDTLCFSSAYVSGVSPQPSCSRGPRPEGLPSKASGRSVPARALRPEAGKGAWDSKPQGLAEKEGIQGDIEPHHADASKAGPFIHYAHIWKPCHPPDTFLKLSINRKKYTYFSENCIEVLHYFIQAETCTKS